MKRGIYVSKISDAARRRGGQRGAGGRPGSQFYKRGDSQFMPHGALLQVSSILNGPRACTCAGCLDVTRHAIETVRVMMVTSNGKANPTCSRAATPRNGKPEHRLLDR